MVDSKDQRPIAPTWVPAERGNDAGNPDRAEHSNYLDQGDRPQSCNEVFPSDDAALEVEPQTIPLPRRRDLLHFIQRRYALIAVGIWILSLNAAFIAVLILINPRFAERPPNLEPPASESIARSPSPSVQDEGELPVMSLLVIALGCSLGSLIIAQRLKPPKRLTRSPSRSARYASRWPPQASQPSDGDALQPDAEAPPSPRPDDSDAAYPESLDSFPDALPPYSPPSSPRVILPPKIEIDPPVQSEPASAGRLDSDPDFIPLDELDIRRRRSLSSWYDP